jgi:hypothetical protein
MTLAVVREKYIATFDLSAYLRSTNTPHLAATGAPL